MKDIAANEILTVKEREPVLAGGGPVAAPDRAFGCVEGGSAARCATCERR